MSDTVLGIVYTFRNKLDTKIIPCSNIAKYSTDNQEAITMIDE